MYFINKDDLNKFEWINKYNQSALSLKKLAQINESVGLISKKSNWQTTIQVPYTSRDNDASSNKNRAKV